jgi:hypothetical protein
MIGRPNHLHIRGPNPDSNPLNRVGSYFHSAVPTQRPVAAVKTNLKLEMTESLQSVPP